MDSPIASYIREHKLSVREFSEKVDITRQAVHKWLRGAGAVAGERRHDDAVRKRDRAEVIGLQKMVVCHGGGFPS